jgi:hypothetical protein
MGKIDEAEQQLAEFESSATHGNSQSFYMSIENEINALRASNAALTNE